MPPSQPKRDIQPPKPGSECTLKSKLESVIAGQRLIYGNVTALPELGLETERGVAMMAEELKTFPLSTTLGDYNPEMAQHVSGFVPYTLRETVNNLNQSKEQNAYVDAKRLFNCRRRYVSYGLSYQINDLFA